MTAVCERAARAGHANEKSQGSPGFFHGCWPADAFAAHAAGHVLVALVIVVVISAAVRHDDATTEGTGEQHCERGEDG